MEYPYWTGHTFLPLPSERMPVPTNHAIPPFSEAGHRTPPHGAGGYRSSERKGVPVLCQSENSYDGRMSSLLIK